MKLARASAYACLFASFAFLAACNPKPLPSSPDPLNCKDPRNRENPYCAPSGGEPLSAPLKKPAKK